MFGSDMSPRNVEFRLLWPCVEFIKREANPVCFMRPLFIYQQGSPRAILSFG